LWVRETWQRAKGSKYYIYRADKDNPGSAAYYNEHAQIDGGWRPSIFMPREACRLFLRVTGVRVERLTKISEDDAMREGCRAGDRYWNPESTPAHSAKQSFMWLWNMLNAKRGYLWCSDAWVWVYTFERCDRPQGWPEMEG
jgi:hypothetical protein